VSSHETDAQYAMEQPLTYTNIAYYKFVTLEDIPVLRQALLELCSLLELKGTIILGQEGINSCLVGLDASIDQFIAHMHNDSRFADIEFKKSYSSHIPFRKMVVKIKKEIIPMGISSIEPAKSTGKYVGAMELKKWLDGGDEVVFLDTRNDYEVALGTFRNAINPNLEEFRQFPEWVEKNFDNYKDKKVVTFCTGGIRCEKASAFLQQKGFENVYQIQGGILKYLEETKKQAPSEDNYYDGDCFVFDYRVAVDKQLNPANYTICYNCWSTVKAEDVNHPDYKKDTYCPQCKNDYLKKQEKRALTMSQNNARALAIRQERARKIRATMGH